MAYPQYLKTRARYRFFLGLLVARGVRGRMLHVGGCVQRQYRLRGRLRPRRLLHITLIHLGDFEAPDDITDALLRRVQALCDSVDHPAFEVSLDTVMAFRGRGDRKPIVLVGCDGVKKLMAFRAALRAAFLRHGLVIDDAGFNPHVTLSYADRAIDPQALEPLTWTAREFVLICSHLGKSRYTRVKSWPLRAS